MNEMRLQEYARRILREHQTRESVLSLVRELVVEAQLEQSKADQLAGAAGDKG